MFIVTAYCRIIFFLAVMQISFRTEAQEYALDFVRTDCKGMEHHLFSELDSGKVIILDFIMLGCSPCFWATRDLDTIVKAYESTHPGQVKIYSFSYENTHTCEQMFEWRAAGGFTDVTLFTQGAEMVSYYGGMGMPSIVVTGSSMHKVFYNGYGYTSAQDSMIIAAIDNALNYNHSGMDEIEGVYEFKVFPTFFSDRIFVEADEDLCGSEIILFDAYGRQVLNSIVNQSELISISTTALKQGFYFACLKTSDGFSGSVKLIKR